MTGLTSLNIADAALAEKRARDAHQRAREAVEAAQAAAAATADALRLAASGYATLAMAYGHQEGMDTDAFAVFNREILDSVPGTFRMIGPDQYRAVSPRGLVVVMPDEEHARLYADGDLELPADEYAQTP
jgi:hypothetical protein